MRVPCVVVLLLLQVAVLQAASVEEISKLVGEGRWQKAQTEITRELSSSDLAFETRAALLFQSDRMRRMRLDFDKTREQVFQEARKIAPSISKEQFDHWERNGAVEFLNIDGTRWYFAKAAANLFLVNAEARALQGERPGSTLCPYNPADVRSVLANYEKTREKLNTPRTWRFSYVLGVKPGQVPPGETIRAWLPFPHAGNRQANIRLISADPERYVLSSPNDAIASVYVEKPAVDGAPTQFRIEFEYTSHGFYEPIDPARVTPVATNDPALAPFLAQQLPHLAFSDEVRRLSREIIGAETNPYLKARRIFQWVSEHVPRAHAPEYSTLECLPQYALSCGHGDCGIETMTFMTFCRLNGIPARWESGWATGKLSDMHDWCEIYLAPYGWMPVDVYQGLVQSGKQSEKWFYLGGIDGARFVVNTDYAQPLYPEKVFARSEIIDFQRGEVEWRGGNLYFDQWKWDFKAEEIMPEGQKLGTESTTK